MRNVEVLLVTLVALCFAFLDRYPDPPATVHKLSIGLVTHQGCAAEKAPAAILPSGGFPVSPAPRLQPVAYRRPASGDYHRAIWPIAGDSSPPSFTRSI